MIIQKFKFIKFKLPGIQWYCASRYFIVPGHGSENKLVFACMLQFLFSLHLKIKYQINIECSYNKKKY